MDDEGRLYLSGKARSEEYICVYYLYAACPEAAEKLINEIIQKVNTLDSMPERNPLYRDEPWYSRGVRYLPVRKYLVFYTVYAKDDTVFVSRILYGGRDVSKQLD